MMDGKTAMGVTVAIVVGLWVLGFHKKLFFWRKKASSHGGKREPDYNSDEWVELMDQHAPRRGRFTSSQPKE